MRRAAVISVCVAGLVLATAPAALGDPPKPLYQVDCPGLSPVIVHSPPTMLRPGWTLRAPMSSWGRRVTFPKVANSYLHGFRVAPRW